MYCTPNRLKTLQGAISRLLLEVATSLDNVLRLFTSVCSTFTVLLRITLLITLYTAPEPKRRKK
jgi:hypothetical protein